MSELIGKKIYRVSTYGIDTLIGEIDRETTTQAIVRHYKFRKPVSNNMSLIGQSRWSIYSYSIETPELNEKFEKKKMIEAIKSFLGKYNCEDKLDIERLTDFYKSLPVKP